MVRQRNKSVLKRKIMARIKVINYEESDGELKSIYDEMIAKRGKLSEVVKIQSLILLPSKAI